MTGETVDPSQFYGLELNPRAVPIADLVLWLGYLKWQLQNDQRRAHRRAGAARLWHDPRCRRGARLRRRAALRRDDAGKPVTTWDGVTMKASPGDGPARCRTRRRGCRGLRPTRTRAAPTGPRRSSSSATRRSSAARTMRAELGDGYAEALWKARPEVPGGADFVMQWWDEAACSSPAVARRASPNPLRRFGFITTNSITQTFSRRVVERHCRGRVPVSLVFAVADHPWVKGTGLAAVRIAMTVARSATNEGTLGRSSSRGGAEHRYAGGGAGPHVVDRSRRS